MTKKAHKYLHTLIFLLKKKLTSGQYMILWSFIVGLSAGLLAVILKTVAHYLQHLLTESYKSNDFNYIIIVFPLAGIVLTITYIRFFLKNKFGSGSAHILHSIAKKSSFVEKETIYSHVISSALTVGFGGSVGLESPIVVAGAAVGSNYGRVMLMNYKERTLLLASGAAAGISAVFNAPIAGVMFALEVLLTDITISGFIPIIIASAAGALCSNIILQEKILLSFNLHSPFDYENIPFYVGLAIVTSLFSLFYARVFLKVEKSFKKGKARTYPKAIVGGILLGLIILIFPPLFGEGYESIKILASGNPERILDNTFFSFLQDNNLFLILFIAVIGLLKAFAASITVGSGGNGGNFAPSLFGGAFLGFAFAKILALFGINIPVFNFIIVGMAGVLTGIMYAPLTGIFLIAELTGGYQLIIPLMLVSTLTYAIVKHFEPYSLDKRDLAEEGNLLTYNRDKNILTMLELSSLIETNFKIVPHNANINQLVDIISHSKRNIFPVVDGDNNLIGIISLDEIREFLFEMSVYKDMLALELVSKPPAVVEFDEHMDSVMEKFDETGAWNLPVVKEKKYVGFISKSSVFSKYRNKLISDYSQE